MKAWFVGRSYRVGAGRRVRSACDRCSAIGAAVPLEVTVATSMLVKASPTFADCPDPLVAAIAIVGGGGGVVLELLLQPVRTRKPGKPKSMRKCW